MNFLAKQNIKYAAIIYWSITPRKYTFFITNLN